MDRRTFLAAAGAVGLSPLATLARADAPTAFIAARKDADGSHYAVAMDADGRDLFRERLDGRGHDAAVSPDGTVAVMFARRPGRFALVLDLRAGRRKAAFAPPADRHFYGHGFFTPDGRLLYATENDYEAERGVLGVYDVAAGFHRIGELDTGGIGPHEAILMADGRTVVVANGGIATHPDFPREKLNLPTMAPSLVALDLATGDILERASLASDLHKLSIRHMAEAADGSIWFGGQYEGPALDDVDLVGRYRPGAPIALVALPEGYGGMAQYVGSVAASRDGRRIATSSPRGGRVVVFDAVSCDVVETRRIADVCGLAPSGSDFLASDGLGRVWRGRERAASAEGHWDNHILAT